MNNKKYCVVLVEEESPYNVMINTMFADLIRLENCFLVEENSVFKNKKYELLKSRKARKVFGTIMDPILEKQYKLGTRLDELTVDYKEIIVLFLNSSFVHTKYPKEILMKWKQKYNVKFVLFYIDILSAYVSKHSNYLRNAHVFDLIYSVDQKDCLENKFIFWRAPYSKIFDLNLENKIVDLYFCGADKGRVKELKAIANGCKEHNISYRMEVVGDQNASQEFLDMEDIEVKNNENGYWDYRVLLQNTVHSKCVLEVCQKNQSASTLRLYEAVLYNLKFLSNNPHIKENPYYNPEFMQYYSKVENIDWNWFLENTNVEYNYCGEFSPLILLNDILCRLG